MRNFYNTIPFPTVILSLEGDIVQLNDAAKSLHLDRSEMRDCSNHTLFHPLNLEVSHCQLCQAIENQETIKALELHDNIAQTMTQYYINYEEIKGKMYVVQVSMDITDDYKNQEKINIYKERIKLAFNGYNAGKWEWDLVDGNIYISHEWKEMLGYESDETVSNILLRWSDKVHPDDYHNVKLDVTEALKHKKEKLESIHRLKHKDGYWIWVLGRAFVEYSAKGIPLCMIGIHTDITNQKELQNKFEERGKILDNSLNEIYIFDADTFKFLYLNKGAKKNIGYTFEEMKHLTPLDIQPELTKEEFDNVLVPITEEGEDHIQFSSVYIRKDGTQYFVDVSLQSTIFEGKKAYVAIILDVTKRVEAEKLMTLQRDILYHQAHHHALTELPNRILFTQKLEEGMKKAEENNTFLALFFIDLDKFKPINDIFGHEMGDKVLKEAAVCLSRIIRDEDTLAHISGDEFVIIMEGLIKVEHASVLANKVLKSLKKPMKIYHHELMISGSIGISFFPQDAHTVQTLLKCADLAMYHAKNTGRNKFQYYRTDMVIDYTI